MSQLKKLQSFLKSKSIRAYVIPKNDEFFNSGMPLSKDRLFKATGFTGSSGYAVILADESKQSAFVTDSRYDLQANAEISKEQFKVSTNAISMSKCISDFKNEGDPYVDAKLFPVSMIENLKKISNVQINYGTPLID